MHNLDPNDMDALFRDGADQHEFTYNPDAWALMEEKLDNHKRRKLIFWWIFGALIVAGVIGLYIATNFSKSSAPVASKVNVDIAESKSTVIHPSIKKENSYARIENGIGSDIKTDINELQNKETINKISPEVKSKGEEEYINIDSKVRSSYIGAQNSFQSENTGSLVDNEVVSVSSPSNFQTRNSETVNTKTNTKGNSKTIHEINISPSTNEGQGLRESLGVSQLEFKKSTEVLAVNKDRFYPDLEMADIAQPIEMPTNRRYVFSAFTSSDVSSVGFFKDPQSGFTIGGKLGIQAANKFQFDAGFAYSLKRYGSEGLDYNLEGGWNSMTGVSPTWMDGKGNILQIQIEVSYYFKGYDKNSFFVNAGISSFIFNSEWYGFEYDPEDLLQNPDAIVEITMEDIRRKNFHPAGIARLSAGYQRIMSPSMALEISPYLQIPLTGIGEGRVDLYTAGVQFAVKFNTK